MVFTGTPDLSIPELKRYWFLGQGLSIGLGMALALRLDKKKIMSMSLWGDGEQTEGQLWEAAMAASTFKVDNLTAFLDWNKVQATGFTKEIFEVPNLKEKWASFDVNVFVIDGQY